MTNANKPIYLVITHTERPAKGEKTHLKNWGKTGRWETFETAIVTDSLKTRVAAEATVIINVNNGKIEKSRLTTPSDKLFVEYVDRYSKNIAQFIAKYYPEILEEFAKTYEKKTVEEKNTEETVLTN